MSSSRAWRGLTTTRRSKPRNAPADHCTTSSPATARRRLGANLAEDAIYPLAYIDADGQPFTGKHRYVWHLAQEDLPPVNAFWSLTLYDAEGFQVANDLNRFAIGDGDDLAFNNDGSLDIHIQNDMPGSGTSNWLPAPEGGFNLCSRLYYPKPEALDGTWTPPAVTKAASVPVRRCVSSSGRCGR